MTTVTLLALECDSCGAATQALPLKPRARRKDARLHLRWVYIIHNGIGCDLCPSCFAEYRLGENYHTQRKRRLRRQKERSNGRSQ